MNSPTTDITTKPCPHFDIRMSILVVYMQQVQHTPMPGPELPTHLQEVHTEASLAEALPLW